MGILYMLILAFFYFLPTLVGSGKKNIAAIFILNLLAGWTFIGWIVALVWASCKDDNREAGR